MKILAYIVYTVLMGMIGKEIENKCLSYQIFVIS